MAQEMKAQFSEQLQQMPMLRQNLEKISTIPAALDHLISRMEKSNMILSSSVTNTMNATVKAIASHQPTIEGIQSERPQIPNWMKWTTVTSAVIIALYCIFNVVLFVHQFFTE